MALTEERFLDLAGRGVSSLSISLDGLSERSNDLLRIGARVDVLLPRIRALSAARARLTRPVRMGISWTLTKSNREELDDAVRFAQDAGLDWMKVEEMFPVNERGEQERLADDEARALLARASRLAAELGLPLLDHTAPLQVWKCDPAILPVGTDEMRRVGALDDFVNGVELNPCRMPWEVVCVEPNGDVKPMGFEHMVAGNVLEEDLGAIFNKTAFQLARRRSANHRECTPGKASCPRDPGPT